MLTQQDLQAISNLLDERLEIKLEEKLEKKLRLIRKDIKRLEKVLITTTTFFDNQLLNHNKRIEHLELFVNIPR